LCEKNENILVKNLDKFPYFVTGEPWDKIEDGRSLESKQGKLGKHLPLDSVSPKDRLLAAPDAVTDNCNVRLT
jgi:hypothetical protein